MSNWLSGLRRFGLLLVTGCVGLIASSPAAHAQTFAYEPDEQFGQQGLFSLDGGRC